MVNRVLWRDHSRVGSGVRQEKEVAALVGLSPQDVIPGSEQKGWGQDSDPEEGASEAQPGRMFSIPTGGPGWQPHLDSVGGEARGTLGPCFRDQRRVGLQAEHPQRPQITGCQPPTSPSSPGASASQLPRRLLRHS